MKILEQGQQVKVDSWKWKTIVKVGYVDSLEGLERCKKNNWAIAYTYAQGTIITANYDGKDADIEKEQKAYADAISLIDGETVLINNQKYKVKILCLAESKYSDPIHFLPVKTEVEKLTEKDLIDHMFSAIENYRNADKFKWTNSEVLTGLENDLKKFFLESIKTKK